MKPSFLQISFLLALFVGFTSAPTYSQAQAVSCQRIHTITKSLSRNQVAAFLIKNSIPAVETQDQVPVVLANKTTMKQLTPLLETSLGIQVALQPAWKNDHGLIRVGNFIIDMDTPGARGFGELHKTGLSWKNAQEYVQRKGDNASKVVEVLYSLTPAEFQVASTYQRVRRAAIYRAPFTFGAGNNKLDLPNMIPNAGEHCFTFCRSSSLDSQIYFMKAEVQKLTNQNFEQLKNQPAIAKFLKDSTAAIMAADVNAPEKLNNRLVLNLPSTKAAVALVAAGKSSTDQQLILNWLLALDSSLKYSNLIQDLGISGGNGYEGSANSRASAIVVYDVSSPAEKFRSSAYRLPGIFSTWEHKNTLPLREVAPEDIIVEVKKANLSFFGKIKNFFH